MPKLMVLIIALLLGVGVTAAPAGAGNPKRSATKLTPDKVEAGGENIRRTTQGSHNGTSSSTTPLHLGSQSSGAGAGKITFSPQPSAVRR
jgi:hypothetical protein